MTNDVSSAPSSTIIDPPPWYLGCSLGMEVGPTGSQAGINPNDVDYAVEFRGDEIVRRCLEAGSQYLIIWARDGDWAYYNSPTLRVAPGLCGRDVLQEAVDTARPHHLPIIAYCVVQQPGLFLSDHPEFAMQASDGTVLDRLCFNSGYAQSLLAMLEEMLAYGVDGFHVDMVDQGFGPPYGCWCPTCRTMFEGDYGHPMPSGPTWDESWRHMLEFRYSTSQLLERAMTNFVHGRAPEATINFNYHGNPPFSWEVGQRPAQHAATGDFVSGETGVWAFSALSASLYPEIYRTAARGGHYQAAMQRSARVYHDQTTRPTVDIRWELLTLRAHGAQVTMIDKTAYDGWLDPVTYRRVGDAFKDAEERAASFGGAPQQDVGLYLSAKTRDWYGREEPLTYLDAFQGAHRAMVLDHQLWGVLLDEIVEPADLRRYAVVVLPNVAVLSDEEIAMLTNYVKAGGNLVITGWSGQADQDGNLTDQTNLGALIGAEVEGRRSERDHHVRFRQVDVDVHPELTAGLDPDWPFLVVGDVCVYAPTTAVAIGELLAPHRTLRQREGQQSADVPSSAHRPVGPAMLINRVDHGTVITFAGSPDQATWSEYPLPEARRLLANATRHLTSHASIQIEAPPYVEAVVNRQDNQTTVVHLIGYSPTPAASPIGRRTSVPRPYIFPGLIEAAASFTATITVDCPIDAISTLTPSSRIEITDSTSLTVTVHDVHEAITIRMQAGPQ